MINNNINNNKKFWKLVSIEKGNSGVPAVLKGRAAKNPEEIWNLFVEYFESVFIKSDKTININSCSNYNQSHLTSVCIELDDIYENLKGLDPRKGAGCDDIPSFFIKNCAQGLAYPLF